MAYIESQAPRNPNLEGVFYRGYWKGVFHGIGALAIVLLAGNLFARFF
jgi:hypothetical protein